MININGEHQRSLSSSPLACAEVVMSNTLFDNAPEYDSDMDTLADFVIEPTTAHIPPPPSPLPNTCLCGRTTRDDDADTDEPLYCSEACARLDAFHALTARSRSNSLAPTPITTAPATPLFPQVPLRESIAGLLIRPDAIGTPPAVSTPLSAVSSFTSVDSVPLPIEMSSHYRRVTAKRERMERACDERDRSRSHSRTHSKAWPLLELEEDWHAETHVERQVGSDGEEHVPAPTTVHVHIAVNVQVEHHAPDNRLDADQLSRALSATMLGPASGVFWRNPFPDQAVSSPTKESLITPIGISDSYEPPSSDLISIAETEEDFSPFVAYAPISVPPSGLPSRKSSVCFAGIGPTGRIPPTRPRAQSNAPTCEESVDNLSEKPLPSTPEGASPVSSTAESSKAVPETPIEPPAESSPSPVIPMESAALYSPGFSLDLPSPMPSFDLAPEPATPTSSTAPASPSTPSHIQHADFDPQATPPHSAVLPASGDTPKHSPALVSRPSTSPQRRIPRRLQTLDSLPRAKIFSMVVDPDLDVLAAEAEPPASAAASLKRVDTAPELTMGRDAGIQYPVADAAISPETPHKNHQLRTRARATSTPRRPNLPLRQRTSSTPSPPGAVPLGQKAPRRARMHPPPPTPPVSPSQVSSPRPAIGQDPGTWQSFGAVFDALGWNAGSGPNRLSRQLSMDELGMGLHRRQESAESSGSSATDVSWSSSSAPLSSSSVYSWTANGGEAESHSYVPGILRARSPATSSVRTIVPPPRKSSLAGDGSDTEHMGLQLCHTRRSRRQSSLAALDSVLAMEDGFWEQSVVVRDADDSLENDGMAPGVQFRGDAGGFAFPATKDKPAFEPVLRIAGISRPPSAANLMNSGSGSRVTDNTPARLEHLTPPTIDHHAHRAPASQFPVSPSIASVRPSPEIDVAASPMPPHMSSTSLFDGPMTASPIMGTPSLSRGSPALPNGSPISAQFALRTPGSPYLSVPLGPSRRASRSTDASSVLLRTASAARLAAALNAADDDEEASPRRGFEDLPYARYSPGTGHRLRLRRSGSLGRSSSLGGSGSGMGLGLALGGLGDYDSRRSSSEPWNGVTTGSVITPGIVASETISMSRSGSRMNLRDPPVLAVPEEEEEPEEDYGQVVSASKFSNIAVSPGQLSIEEAGDEASPLIDAFPHPMGGYFPGSRFASRAGTPVKGLNGSSSGLSLQIAVGNARQENTEEEEPSDDEDEEIVTTVQRMRHSMQLLSAV
ncbi:GJ11159 gene product from transcript GJ11159-RA [Rhizoctonia solani AG-1 IB]|uniref:GJ11159 gene product from transcript GJ11159-RA n=1 Tax=Thanatephorus cucumeris (strain AG1-IB / isolate 7/3/14) TaxID=1108050 RepID=A0A0B7F2Q1_THACB|nr:GJ11159 gene product from transcript GJ11159-RA [Rhizoctonia solani AG-1 IB]